LHRLSEEAEFGLPDDKFTVMHEDTESKDLESSPGTGK